MQLFDFDYHVQHAAAIIAARIHPLGRQADPTRYVNIQHALHALTTTICTCNQKFSEL